MKKEISVSYSKTINLGNYESARVQAGITQEIFERDPRSNERIFEDLFDECESFVLKQCKDKAR